jgi:hypothetical protein
MSNNQPWNIWWDFRWLDNEIRWVVVQTDHPKYKHVDHIYKFLVDELQSPEGTIDEWVDQWFNPFVSDVKSGRKSLHKIMKSANHSKEIVNGD